MFKLVAFALILALASANFQAQWVVYKKNFNKTYSNDEDTLRRFVYRENMMRIQKHNELFYAKGLSSFSMGENQFTDMTTEEVNAKMNGYKMQRRIGERGEDFAHVQETSATVDWRNKGYVTPVKNQADCGSCWAFSTTGSLEGQHFAKEKKLVSLSESNLVDCSTQNNGCDGGSMGLAFDYIKNNGGIDTEQSYPYVARQQTCKFQKSNVGATATGYVNIKKDDETALQKAVDKIGPISVAINAGLQSFHDYKKGVYNDPDCNSFELDHGVLVVGYGTENGEKYWLVKNSWGADWGENGYIKMSRDKNNQCGIATAALYPTV